MNEFFGRSLTEKFIEEYWDKIIKDTLEELKRENRKLKIKLKENQRTLEHRDSVLSIMYDLVRTTITADEDIIKMIEAVIDVECWLDISKEQKKLVKAFYNREF